VHDTDDEDPVSALNFPASHEMQSAEIVEPVALLNVPATHDVHALCPVELWYLRTSDEVFDEKLLKREPKSTYFPAGHELQAVDAIDPVTALYLPVLHEVHDVCPVEAWYLTKQS
jgi:hypothetical protein